MNKLLYIKIGLPIVIVLLLILAPASRQLLHLSGSTMGTTYNVKFLELDGVEAQSMQTEIDALLAQVNKQMSTYDPGSELSRFNQHQDNSPFSLSSDTLLVLREAKRLGELSHGVLDVTVGPLVNLWGFGPTKRPEKTPQAAQIAQAKRRVGLHKLQLAQHSASKSQADLYVDLSTIAKGFAVDKVAELLEHKGISDYLVEIGGEMRVSGHKKDGQSWLIAVEKPVSDKRAIQEIIAIGNNAVATSGDYRNYYEQDGVRYSHLIDPRSGYPIQHNTVAVTVVHPSSMTADGLATALIVMGKDEAMALAEKHDLAVLLITKEKQQFKEYTSAAFKRMVDIVN